jgi:phage gpG-like protein
MADIFVEFELDTSRADEVFSRLIQKGGDLSPLMAQIAELLVQIKDRAFANETAPDGIPWPELAESTQKRKVYGKPRGAHPMLRVSDAFHDSIESSSGTDFAEIATALGLPYPSFLQTGTSRMPARPVFGLEPTSAETIEALAAAYLVAGI